MRAGACALTLLSAPINASVLQALEEGPLSLLDLRRAAGSPPQTTVRVHLRALEEAGILERSRDNGFPLSVTYRIKDAGLELLQVGAILRTWLQMAPEGPIALGTPTAKSSIKALVEGWSCSIVRALAARPLSLTELSRLISDLTYPSLERRLGAMRLAGQIERCPGAARRTPYRATEWLRRATAPLTAAARWERRHLAADTAPIGKSDIESVFLLSVPLLALPSHLSGTCRMAVGGSGNGTGGRLAGVVIGVEEGRVTSCVARLQQEAEAWVVGSPSAWLEAVLDGDHSALERGGELELAAELVRGLHGAPLRAVERT